LPEALTMARQLDLDLVEVAPLANPPVCRIMDYGKFRYEESQKAKESRKKTIHVSIKEVKLRPKIGKGDLDTKIRHMQEFLSEGHKVKVTLQFRGREMAHPELGSRLLDSVISQVDGLGKVETQARLEGRNMTMVLAPEKKPPVKKERSAPSSGADQPESEATESDSAATGATEPTAPEPASTEPASTEPASTEPAALATTPDTTPAPAAQPAPEPAPTAAATLDPVTPSPVESDT
jgi:translation initiation factor IF-3